MWVKLKFHQLSKGVQMEPIFWKSKQLKNDCNHLSWNAISSWKIWVYGTYCYSSEILEYCYKGSAYILIGSDYHRRAHFRVLLHQLSMNETLDDFGHVCLVAILDENHRVNQEATFGNVSFYERFLWKGVDRASIFLYLDAMWNGPSPMLNLFHLMRWNAGHL